jgi:hypothetical protein
MQILTFWSDFKGFVLGFDEGTPFANSIFGTFFVFIPCSYICMYIAKTDTK